MSNIDAIVNDILSQLRVYSTLKKRAAVNVYVAKQNLKPVVELLLKKAETVHHVSFDNLDRYIWFVDQVLGHTLNIWQKPDPYPEGANHLTLTVNGLTAVIYDYEESSYE